jgi:uncharacterized protein (TIGR02466 family)
MLTPLFTDAVWNTPFKTDLKDYCDFVRNNDKGRIISNNGGYQSNNLNLKEPVLQPLVQFILNETRKYSSVFNLKRKDFKLECMWININGYKDYNEEHTHIGSLFSGVYYVSAPKNCGDIQFVKSSNYLMSDWRNEQYEYNTSNCGVWFLPAKTHQCYLFPAYYIHKVKPNLNKEEERYSISFNLS